MKPILLSLALNAICAAQSVPADSAVRLDIQIGHAEPVSAAAFSPDGKLVATASEGLVTMWDLETGRQIYQRFGGWKNVTSLAFLTGNRLLVTAIIPADAADGGSLLEVDTGRTIPTTYRAVDSCANGSLILAPDGDSRSALIDEPTGRRVASLPFTSGKAVFAGRRLACSDDKRLALVAAPRPGNNPDGELIAELWDITAGKMLRALPAGPHGIVYVALSPDGQMAATADRGGAGIRVWDIQSGSEMRTLAGFNPLTPGELAVANQILGGQSKDQVPPIFSMAFSPDSKLLAGGGKGKAIVWEARTGRETAQFPRVMDNTVECIAFSADSKLILIGDTIPGIEIDEVALRLVPISGLNYGVPLAGMGTGAGIGSPGSGLGKAPPQVGASVNTQPKTPPPPVIPPGFGQQIVVRTRLTSLMNRGSECRISPDGRYLFMIPTGDGVASFMGRPLRYFDLKTGRWGQWAASEVGVTSINFGVGGSIMMLGHIDGSVATWNLSQQSLVSRENGLSSGSADSRIVTAAAVLPGIEVVIGYRDGTVRTISRTGEKRAQLPASRVMLDELLVSPTGQVISAISSTTAGWVDTMHSSTDPSKLTGVAGELWLSNLDGKRLFQIPTKVRARGLATFTPDGKSAVVSDALTVGIYDTSTGTLRSKLPGASAVRRLAVSNDGKRLVTATLQGEIAVWDLQTSRVLWRFPRQGNGGVTSVAFLAGDRRVFASQSDGTTRFLNTSDGQLLATLAIRADMEWTVATPDGRFDASRFDSGLPLHWVARDEPLQPLPIEMFLQDFYEPRLLPRLLAGESLRPVPRLADVNRLVPEVTIAEVAAETDDPTSLRVRVEAREATNPKTGKTSGVYDIRLLRDGRLVGYSPAGGGAAPVSNGKGSVEFRHVHLTDQGLAALSVYAFNDSGVKTVTKEYTFSNGTLAPLSNDMPSFLFQRASATFGGGRPWIVTLGVGKSALPELDLRYAPNDARRMSADLVQYFKEGNQVQPANIAMLISDDQHPDGAKKEYFRKALESMVPLVKPRDVVIISFSGHGYAGPDGKFYLIPSDAGRDLGGKLAGNVDRLLAESISSDELSLWLRDIDAGQIALILDTCQSAASVESGGLKPGAPMASRGLGQLAYDKGIIILAATQASNVAIESSQVGQGLLTYALTHDGLEVNKADWRPVDGNIDLREWLNYGVKRVPELWRQITDGKFQDAPSARALIDRGIKLPEDGDSSQQPALFDFSNLKKDVVLKYVKGPPEPPKAPANAGGRGVPAGILGILAAPPPPPAPILTGTAPPGVYRAGGNVSQPVVTHKVEPEYTTAAHDAKLQGTVSLYVQVNPEGLPVNIEVTKSLGMGLDEKAIEAVKQWRFAPGKLDGKAVTVEAIVAVQFRLL